MGGDYSSAVLKRRLSRPAAARAPLAVLAAVVDEHGIDEQRAPDALDAEVRDERVGAWRSIGRPHVSQGGERSRHGAQSTRRA
jgi:hypothetical protein